MVRPSGTIPPRETEAPPLPPPPVQSLELDVAFADIGIPGTHDSRGKAESHSSWLARHTSFAISLIVNLCLLIALAAWHVGELPKPTQIELASLPDEPEFEQLVEISKPEGLLPEELQLSSASGDLTSLPEAPEIEPQLEPSSAHDLAGGEPLLDDGLLASNLLESIGRGSGGGGSGGAGPNFGDASLFEFVDRLQRAGAKTGDVQVSLIWDNFNDLDLHVITPRGETIFFGHRRSRDRGILDVDMNAGRGVTREPVENVYWAKGTAPLGKFKVLVHHYRNHGDPDPTPFEVRVLVDGEATILRGEATFGERRSKVFEFTRTALGSGPASAASPSPNADFLLRQRN